MKVIYTFFWLAVLSILPVASGQSVLRTYFADDLVRIPGLVQVSPGFTTVIDFWDTVTTLASAQAQLLRVESAGPRILLSATQPAGRTDLVVVVGGRTLLFTLVIGPGTGPRRYVIELTRARPATPGTGVMPPATVAPVRPPVAAPQPAPAPRPPTAPAQPAQQPPEAEAVNPEHIRFTTTAQVPSDARGSVTIFFTLENRGERALAADPGRLMIVQGEDRLNYSLTRSPLRTLINPGEAQSGLITLEQVRAGEVRFEWRLIEIGTGRPFLLQRTVMAGTRIELEGR